MSLPEKKMKITLEIERIGFAQEPDRYECRATFEHDLTSFTALGTSIGETLLNLIEFIRPTIARKLPR